MVRKGYILVLMLFCFTRSLAIDASLSHTLFYIPDPAQTGKLLPNLEAYWQINPGTLHYNLTPEKTIVARIKTDIIFTDGTGIIKEDHYILQTVPRTNVQELRTHSIIELRKYTLPAGFIHMKLMMTDLNDSTNKFSVTDTFTINAPSNTAYYSGLQLLDTIIPSPAQTNFLKNGVQQVPACANFLDDNKHTLNYYAERYLTHKTPKSEYPLYQRIMISKNDDEAYFAGFNKKDSISEESLARVSGSFAIRSLPSGNYTLRIVLENKDHIAIAAQSLFFQRLNKNPGELAPDTTTKSVVKAAADTGIENVTVLNLKKTFVAKYTLNEIRAILKMLLPFSDPGATMSIRNFLKKPDELYMRYYVYNYFANIDKKDPAAAFKDFSVKIIKVNELFNSHGVAGYETDRGFIYLRYGKPDDIVTIEGENGSVPYEIWQYNQLTQTNHKEITDAFFLFYRQTQGLSDFRILHSSVDGEAKNMDWRNTLYTSGSNQNSRAEQYIGNR